MTTRTHKVHNKLLKINSIDRIPSSFSSSNFTINFPNVKPLERVVSVVLKHVSFPNVFYNISSLNNTFKWNASTVTLPVGFYSLETLIKDLNVLIGTGGIGISQNPLTLTLSFLNNTGTGPLTIYDESGGSTLSPVLGLHKPILNLPENQTYTSPDVPQLQGLTHLYIASKFLSKGHNMIAPNERQELPIIGMIPVIVPYASINHWETPHEQLDIINYPEANLQTIDIQLYDGLGNPLDLRGTDINIILKIYYKV